MPDSPKPSLPERIEVMFREMECCGYESQYTLRDLRLAIAEEIEKAREEAKREG